MKDEEKPKEQLLEEISQLRENHQYYKFLFDNAPLSYISIDENGRITKANRTCLEYLNYSEEELIGNFLDKFISPDYLEDFTNFFDKFLEEGVAKDVEFEILKKGGTKILFSINGKIAYDSKGHCIKGHIILNDIKEKRTVLEAITASRQRLYSLLEELPAYVCVYGPDLSMKFVNRYLRDNFDLADGKSCHKIFHGFEDRSQEPCSSCPVLDVFSTKKINIRERTQVNGKTYQIYDFPFKDYDGTMLTVEMGIDITERKKIQEELQKRENTLNGIFAAAPIGIGLIKDREIQWCNPRMCQMTGYPYEELIKNDTKVFYEQEKEYNQIGRELDTGHKENKMVEIETRWKRKNGSVFDCHLRSSPLDPLNPENGHIITIMDITDRKKAQTQLEENIHYIAFLIDNIRNPLSIISGYAELKIEDERMNKRILNQVDRIEDLIEGLDKGWIDSEDTKEFLRSFM
ncbi:MAG TPA: PAS domain S-box protein [Methanofastidiosum sp.]|nr:PAS domain S-box protein [Methanofastidiosum sp.]HNU60808.1 PAS domain S-box protein [Methanofastidiosum sp.]